MEQDLIKKLLISRKKPKDFEDLKPSELADLVLIVLDYAKKINAAIEQGKIRGEPAKDLVPDKDYLSLKTAKKEINAAIFEAVTDAMGVLNSGMANLSRRVEARLEKIRDGKDAVITEEHISKAAALAFQMIRLPDFASLITEQPDAIRDSLELLQGDERLSKDAISGLSETIEDLEKRLTKRIGEMKGGSSGGSLYRLRSLLDVDVEGATAGQVLTRKADGTFYFTTPSGGGISDGDKGDITVSGSGTVWDINAATVGVTELSATGTPSASTFLRGDNTWATPAGSGDVSKVGTPVDNQVGVWTGDGTIEGDANLTFDTATDTLETVNLSIDRIQFDTAATPATNAEGLLQWNATDGTLDLGMSGGDIKLQVGQESFAKARNATGVTITNGSPVYYDGSIGNRPTIALAQGNSAAAGRFVGLATQDIANNADGFITTMGYVRQIKTNYTGSGIWGTTWVEGDLLYVSKTDAGVLTNVEPSAPHYSDVVGEVGVVGPAGTGSILVAPTKHYTLEGLSDVNGTALTTTGQIPVWDNTAGYFDFTSNVNDYAPLASPTFTGTVTAPAISLSGATASTVAIFDASKNLISASTATYPSLTELSYLKGATSAVQTQLDAKLSTAAAAATYQPLDSDLTTIAGLAATTDNFIVSVASAWASRTPAQVRTTLSLNNVENTALSTWAGSSNITTLGTISTGTWNGTDIAVADGGTGRSTGTTAYSLIATGTTATGAQQTLANGATTEILVGGGASALPVWTTATGSGSPVRATSPTFATSVIGSATMAVFNTTSTTITAFGAATTMTIGGTPTTAVTHNYSTNATATATTKTVNLGTGGAAGSTTNVNIGATAGGTTTISSPTISLGGTTGATTTGTIELGAASDTTISRSAAGVIAVEGVVIPSISSTNTLTNKRIQPRTASSTSDANLTPDLSTANVYFRTTQTVTLAINAPTGTPVIGETIVMYIDSAGAQTVNFNATYVPFGAAFPATTTAGKTMMVTAQYNGTNWKTIVTSAA